jgi:GNAT superfamily N-acetyltransferase
MPMDGRWAIRLYHEGDEGALLQLRTLCFPKDDPRSQRERQMWLRRNPYGCQGWVAAAGGEVIGYEGLLLAPLQLLNHQAFAGIRFDLMVAPRHRGKGIGHALVSTCHREIEQSGAELSLGFTNALSSRLAEASRGVLLGDLPAFFYPTSILGRLGLGMWGIRHPLSKAHNSALHSPEPVHIDVEPLRPAIADLHRLASLDGRFGDHRIIRTLPWLDWRYLQCPEPHMRFLIVRAHGEIIGYVAYSAQRFRRHLKIGKIEHVAFPPNVPVTTAKDALVKVLSSSDGIDLWWSRAFLDSEYGRLLSAIGFSHCQSVASRVVVTIPAEQPKELVLDRSRWYLSPSDML